MRVLPDFSEDVIFKKTSEIIKLYPILKEKYDIRDDEEKEQIRAVIAGLDEELA